MSMWATLKSRIRNPNLGLLKKALEILAKELNSKVVENFVVEGWMARQKCVFGIPMKLPYGNGYGVYVDSNGFLRVVVDEHGAPMTAQQFLNKLQQYYVTLAVIQAGQQLGYQVNVQQLPQGILVDLVR